MSDELVNKIKSQPKAIELLGDFLWECIICEPIEKEVESKIFFEIINIFYELISPKNIPSTDLALQRLSKIFQKSASDQIMKRIDPDSVKFYEQPTAFYLNFYRLIAEAIKTRDDVKSCIEKDLVTLIDQCIKVNLFIDEFQPGGLTVFYLIGLAFTVTILSSKNYNSQLVDKILTMWFNLKQEEPDNEHVNTMFSTAVQLSSANYPQILAKRINKLWDYFLDGEHDSFIMPLYQAFGYNVASFKQYEERFFDHLILADDRVLNSTVLLLSNIAQFSYEFFFIKSTKHNGSLRMFVLVDIGIKRQNDSFLATIINSFNIAIDQVNNTKQSKVNLTSLFEQRSNLNSLMKYNNKLIPSFISLATMLFVNYYTILIDGMFIFI